MVKQREIMEARSRERRPERREADWRFKDDEDGPRLAARDGRKGTRRREPRATAQGWDLDDED